MIIQEHRFEPSNCGIHFKDTGLSFIKDPLFANSHLPIKLESPLLHNQQILFIFKPTNEAPSPREPSNLIRKLQDRVDVFAVRQICLIERIS